MHTPDTLREGIALEYPHPEKDSVMIKIRVMRVIRTARQASVTFYVEGKLHEVEIQEFCNMANLAALILPRS
jgi:hypothetical protein